MKHLFIVNPEAGGVKGRIGEIRREIEGVSESLDAPCEIYITQAPMDACRKIKEEADLAEMLYVYACGGDGTLNECANGAANRPNVAITQYPCGTGNDFLRMFGLENLAMFRDLRSLTAGTVRILDLIDCHGRYGINICSVGIDARIGADVHKYSGIPIIGGATGYVVSLIVNVIKGVSQKFKITIDDKTVEKKVTLVCACNGRFYGGGFNPVPDAIPDDGILEYLIIEPVSRLVVAGIVGKYAKGRYRELEDLITHVRGGNIEIEGDREFVVNIDGEIIHTKSIGFKVVPKGVNFIFPSEMKYFDS
jgi:YegS/Rv2252/BmrU family lipid kinase